MITAVPALVRVYDRSIRVVEINFLCVHKEYRNRGLAPQLIQHITQLARQEGIEQAVYTSGTALPTAISVAQYYHRTLNPRKTIAVTFSYPNPNMTIDEMQEFYCPGSPQLKWRRVTSDDISSVRTLLNRSMKELAFAPEYVSDEECGHWCLPRDNVVCSFVLEDDTNTITDFTSFYLIPSSVLEPSAAYESIEIAWLYMTAAQTIPFEMLVAETIALAWNEQKCDVFNALKMGQSTREVLRANKFKEGTGFLKYYIYNWRCPAVDETQLGLVLL